MGNAPAYLVHMVYGRPSTLPVEDGEGGSESRDYDDLPSWTPGHPDPPSWVAGHPDPPYWARGHPFPPRWNNHARHTEFHIHRGTNNRLTDRNCTVQLPRNNDFGQLR